MPVSLSQWMISEAGQAVASWVANGLAVLAIVLALLVALIEQRRANRDKLREQQREREAMERQQKADDARRAHLFKIVEGLVDRALTVMTTELPNPGNMYMRWWPDDGKPLELKMTCSPETPPV
jgi:heme exporter protein D